MRMLACAKSFGEKIGWVLMARNVVEYDGLDLDLFTGVMVMYVDVFGAIIIDFVVREHNKGLIVSE